MTSATQRLPVRLAIAATAIACIGVVATIVIPLVPIWPCALFEHFRVQYVAGGLVVAACAAAFGMRGYFDAAAVSAVLHLLWISPDLCRAPRPGPVDGVAVRVLVLNVHTESATFDEVRQLIEDVHPDVVGLVEVDDRWLRGVAPAVAQFPIDHLLASCSIGIADRRVERDVGSDHLPVVIDVVVPRAETKHAGGPWPARPRAPLQLRGECVRRARLLRDARCSCPTGRVTSASSTFMHAS